MKSFIRQNLAGLWVWDFKIENTNMFIVVLNRLVFYFFIFKLSVILPEVTYRCFCTYPAVLGLFMSTFMNGAKKSCYAKRSKCVIIDLQRMAFL